MIVSLGVTGLGEVARALSASPLEFIIWTIPSLAGAGIANVITPPLIKKYFPDRIGLVTSSYVIGVSVSAALPPLFIYQIAVATGWRLATGVWAVIALVGLIPWLAVIFSPGRAGARLAAVKRRLDPRTPVERPPKLARPLWRSPLAWAIMTTFCVNSLVFYTMFPWMPSMLRDAGKTDTEVSFYLTVFTLGSLPGALLVPLIVTRIKRVWILPILFFLGYVTGFTGLWLWTGENTLVWMILTRLGDCFFAYSVTMINLKTRTTRGSTAMSGFVQSVGYTIAVVGPWGFGLLHTLTGGWDLPMIGLLCTLPLQLVAGLVIALSKPLDV